MFWGQIKTTILLVILSGILLLLGGWIGGNVGILFAFGFSLAMNFMVYFYSDKLVLKMYSAKPLDEEKYKFVYDIVEGLCDSAQIPMPKLWLIDSDMANAFATGRNPQNASVAVTRGIMEILEEHELRGVLAHELSHVKNRDILIATVAASIATAIGYLADMLRWAVYFGGIGGRDNRSRGGVWGALLVSIIMPIAAVMVQLAISRSREYLADESGAHISNDPLALASALEKLHYRTQSNKMKPRSNAETAIASLFIVNPFFGEGLISLFSTHPPMKKRIERLHKMAQFH
jgi:heat shock protein HtpX